MEEPSFKYELGKEVLDSLVTLCHSHDTCNDCLIL